MLSKYIQPSSASIGEVAEAINREKTGFAAIIDEQGVLVGTVTDGDLRRAYLSSRDLASSIGTIMCTSPISVPAGTEPGKIAELANRHRIQQIVIVDGLRHPVDVATSRAGLPNMPSIFGSAVIMAGGEGKRLRPYTENIPKPMLEVKGKPILEHLIKNLVSCGIARLFISVNYKADVIIDYFKDGRNYGVEIIYLRENEKLGTAGSLGLLPEMPDQPMLVMNGDVLTNIDYSDFYAFHRKHRGVLTVATTEYKVRVPFGTMSIANQFLVDITEKPEVRFQCNAGVYALEPEVLQYIPPKQMFDMTTLMQDLIHTGLPVGVFPIHEQWMDVGRPEDLLKAAEFDEIAGLPNEKRA